MDMMNGSRKTLLSIIRPYEMDVQPNRALDMTRSPHQSIGYLLRIEHGGFEV